MNVYDFDDTIYDGDSSVNFCLSFLKKDPSLVKFIPDLIKVMAKYRKQEITFDDFMGEYGHLFSDYIKNNYLDLPALAKEFWDKNEDKIKPFYKTIQRDDDLIITASPMFIVKEICDRIGIKHILATEFDTETGEIRRGCFRETKIHFFREAYPDGVIDDFYTDSLNDQFLFPYAKRVFMVKGSKIKRIK